MAQSYDCEFTVKYPIELEYLLRQKASESPETEGKGPVLSLEMTIICLCHYLKLRHFQNC